MRSFHSEGPNRAVDRPWLQEMESKLVDECQGFQISLDSAAGSRA